MKPVRAHLKITLRDVPLLVPYRAIDYSVGRVGIGYRAVIIRGRWAIVVVWLVTAALAGLAPAHTGGAGFGSFLPADHPVLLAQQRVLIFRPCSRAWALALEPHSSRRPIRR